MGFLYGDLKTSNYPIYKKSRDTNSLARSPSSTKKGIAMPILNRLQRHYQGHPFRVFTTTAKIFFAFHLFHEYAFTMGRTWGPSMMPTLEATDVWTLESRLYRGGKGIVAGDLVTFDSVVVPGEKVLKRVLGLEGDYVLRDTPGQSSTMVQVRGLAIAK